MRNDSVFHNRKQRDGETISQFEAELRALASTCNFGQFLGQVGETVAHWDTFYTFYRIYKIANTVAESFV